MNTAHSVEREWMVMSMINIDDVIIYCNKMAEENEEQYKKHPNQLGYREEFYDCQECADNYRQVAEWLKKLQAYEDGSVNGIHKTGKWIEIPNGVGLNWQYPVWQCDVCGSQFTEKTNYCPDCGSINK